MKKFTSILCAALAVAVSMSAGPRVHVQKALKVKSDKAQMEQLLSHAKTEKERTALTYKYKQVLKEQKSAKSTVRRAKQEVQDVTVERYNASIMYGTSVLYGLHNDELNIHFFYQFPLAEGAHDIEFGRTYTLADMEAEGCEWDEYDAQEELIMHPYTAATFTITKGEGYDVHIVATATDESGNEFSLAYDEEALVPTGDTIEVNISRPLNGCDYNDFEHYWLVRAQDNIYNVQLQYYSADSESPAGTFGASDIEFSSTYLSVPTGELDEFDEPIYRDVYAKDGSITVTKTGDRIDVNATILAEDGNVYVITLFFATPEADSQENFVSNDLKVDTWAFDMWGEIQIFASTEDGKYISMDFYGDQEAGIPGTYEINGTNGGSVTVDGEQFAIYSGSVTVAYENDEYSVTGTILCWNNVEYTLNLQEPEVVVVPKNFTSENMVIDVYPSGAFFEVSGFDAEGNYLLLTVNSATVAGDYTASVDGEYTYLEMDGNDYILQSAAIHVTYSDDHATVSGMLHMVNQESKYDEIELSLNLQAGPYVPSERNVTIGRFQHANVANDQILYMVQSEDEQQLFQFVINVGLWDEDVELGKTYTLEDMLSDGCGGQNYAEREFVYYQSVSFTKTALAEDSIQIVITVVDTRGNTWHLTYEGETDELIGLYVDLGQANAYAHADGGVEYEMIDVDNTMSCHLVIPGEMGMEDVVLDSLYSSADGGINLELSYLSIQKVEYKIVEAELRKEAEGDEVWVSANVTDERGYQYMLRFHDDGFVLTGDTIHMYYSTEVSANYSEEYFVWFISAEGTEYNVNFAISCDEESPVGTHVDDIELWNSSVEILEDAAASSWNYVVLHSIEFLTISEIENGYAIEAMVVGEDGNVYDIAVNMSKESVENIETAQKAVKRIVNGMLLIERNGVIYNAQGVIVR